MKKTLLASVFCLLSALSNLVQAQSEPDEVTAVDSTYNLGRVVLKKRDVQAVTIKAADLEKIPFRSLQDVINVYTNGVFAAKQSYIFVIDGVLNTDINAYSIYDIEELTFIQNAATVLNGGDPNKALILVKTKRAGGKGHGVTVAGQTNMVRLYKPTNPSTTSGVPDGKTTTNLYHQYYVSAYAGNHVISGGVSADIQHNITPIYLYDSPYTTRNPPITNRLKLHGYLDAHLGERNTVSLDAGYVPQRDFNNQNSLYTHFESPNLYYGDLKIHTKIADGFYNIATAGIQKIHNHVQHTTYGAPSALYNLYDAADTLSNYILQDNISYETALNDVFTIRPSVNFTYRNVNHPSSYLNEIHFTSGQITSGISHTTANQKLALLTPSITVGYIKFLSLTVGFQTYLNSGTVINGINRLFVNGNQAGYTNNIGSTKATDFEQTSPLPFASLTVDPLALMDVDTTNARLTVYGSYARNFNYSNDLLGSLDDSNLEGSYRTSSTDRSFMLPPVDPYKVYTQIQGGATFTTLENSLTLSYNYSLRRFNTGEVILIRLPTYQDYYMNTNGRTELHRVGIDYSLPTDGDLTWRTSLNGTLLIMSDTYKERDYLSDYMRLVYPGKPFITGGFANHFGYQGLFLDFSILYAMNQANMKQVPYLHYQLNGTTSTFDLQNIDFGYKIPVPVKRVKSLEVYLNARNLFQNGQSRIVETQRFFGGGFKVEL